MSSAGQGLGEGNGEDMRNVTNSSVTYRSAEPKHRNDYMVIDK